METRELLERYQQGERDFAHIDLSGANLSGASLREINLTGADLTGANLSWASLNNAQLMGASLRRTDLRSASLTKVNFDESSLSGANLSKADLRLASLREAELNWAVLSDADLTGANLQKGKLDQVNLEKAKLVGAQLQETELMEANLQRSNLTNANLTGANLRESHLEEANLREAILRNANLIEANLMGASLRMADLTEADLHRVVLTGADLSEAVLDGAELSRANLTGAYLLKTSFKRSHLLRATLQDVYLLRADLSEANLRGADLRRADLSGAYLSEATLSEADLRDAFLLESRLIRTIVDGALLTGCCIHNWQVEEVDLSKVNCDFVFTQFNYNTKSPTNRYPTHGKLEPGELGQTYQEKSSTVEVTFTEAPNWEALVFTLAQMESETRELNLAIANYTSDENGFILRLRSKKMVNAKLLGQRILEIYPDMLQRFVANRPKILGLLNLKVAQRSLPPAAPLPAPPPPSAIDKRLHLTQETARQIRSILLSQQPEQGIEGIQRLLSYLEQQGIPLEEMKKAMIEAIVQRGKQDQVFLDNLLNWEKSSVETIRFSVIGEAIRQSIALLWPGPQNL